MKQNLNINLFGSFGSGKGTQKELLIDKYDLGAIETGEIIRKEIDEETELGAKFKEAYNTGKLVSDELVFEIVNKFFGTYPEDKGIIFDGLPRTLPQKQHFDDLMKKLGRKIINIEIKISDETSLSRQLNLREGRDAEDEEFAQARIHTYKNEVVPVTDAYKEEGQLHRIDGEQSIEEVFEDISRIVDEHMSDNE